MNSTVSKKTSRKKSRKLVPLTDKLVQALKPKLKRYTVRDGRGLFLDITPGGVRTWIFRYQFNGKQEKFTIGRSTEFTLKEAREKRDELAVDVARGISPAEEKKKLQAQSTTQSAKNPSVREFGERYLKEQVDKNWKEPSNEHRYLKKNFFPEVGDRPLKNITAVDVQSVVYRKRDGGCPQQPNSYLLAWFYSAPVAWFYSALDR